MYASYQLLRKKTPSHSIGRKDFILQLVKEYHTATNVEAQEQLVANLANFGYDPINFSHLYEAAAINVFMHALTTPNEHLIIFATAGICNVCLGKNVLPSNSGRISNSAYCWDCLQLEEQDPILRSQIIEPDNINLISEIFQSSENKEVATNILTLFYYLLTEDKSLLENICTVENLKKVSLLKNYSEQDLKNLCQLFLQDFGLNAKNDVE